MWRRQNFYQVLPMATEKAIMRREFRRAERVDRRAHKVLSSCDELPSFVTRIKKRGPGIVEPQLLLEDIKSMMMEPTTALSNEDFVSILTTIREAVVLHFGVAFALHLGDEDWGFVMINDDSLAGVDPLEVSTYSGFRKVSMTGIAEVEEYKQQDEESLEEFMQRVVESPDVVSQPSAGSSRRWYWYSRKKKTSYVIIKKIKQ